MVRQRDGSTQPVISRTIIRRTVAENRAIFTADAAHDERFSHKESTNIAEQHRAVVCVPLVLGGTSQGVIYASRGVGTDPFTQSDVELLTACSVSIALAIQVERQLIRRQQGLWSVLTCLVRGIERTHDCDGSGAKVASVAVAIGRT